MPKFRLEFLDCSETMFDQRLLLLRLLEPPLRWVRLHTHPGGAASRDSSGSENISRPGLRRGEPSGFRIGAWVCEFQSTQHGVNACVVSSCGFGGAAGFSVFQLWVQEGTTQLALAKSCPRPASKSFLRVGDVVVRRQDTSRTHDEMVGPFVGHMRVTQVFDPRNLLPGSFGEECVL